MVIQTTNPSPIKWDDPRVAPDAECRESGTTESGENEDHQKSEVPSGRPIRESVIF
jgi:hypothetical protein